MSVLPTLDRTNIVRRGISIPYDFFGLGAGVGVGVGFSFGFPTGSYSRIDKVRSTLGQDVNDQLTLI